MEMTPETIDIPLADAALRLAVACALAALIGFEREKRERPAGLRTHMLTATAACAYYIVAVRMVSALSGADQAQLDPIRVVEAVTAGAAFLAAGTIIQARGDVIGLTTGASIWLSAAIGLACGGGHFGLAAIIAALALIVLSLLGAIERAIESRKHATLRPAEETESERAVN